MIVVVGSVGGDLVNEGAIINAKSGEPTFNTLRNLIACVRVCNLDGIAWARYEPTDCRRCFQWHNHNLELCQTESHFTLLLDRSRRSENIDYLQWSSDGNFLISQHGNYSPIKLWNMRKMLETSS